MNSIPMSARQVLDRHFLEARAKLLDIAAILDRIDRASDRQQIEGDERRRQLDEALAYLRCGKTGRAEWIQHLFSRPYDSAWIDGDSGLPAAT